VTANQNLAVTFNIPGNKAIAPQVFAGDAVFDYKLTGGTDTDKRTYPLAFGQWTLNGAQVYINYMPYNGISGNISRIVYVSNRGSLAGNIDVRVFSETGGTSCDFSGGPIGPGEIVQLSKKMDDAVYLCFGNTFSVRCTRSCRCPRPRTPLRSTARTTLAVATVARWSTPATAGSLAAAIRSKQA